jgi:hypothetical protein
MASVRGFMSLNAFERGGINIHDRDDGDPVKYKIVYGDRMKKVATGRLSR